MSRLRFHNQIQEGCWDAHIQLPLKVCAATSTQPRTSIPRDQPNWDIWGRCGKWIWHTEDPINSKERSSLPGARAPMSGRMTRTLQSSARVGHSLLGLQTRHCSHRWNRCEEPKDPGAAENAWVFTPKAAPSPPRSGQIYPKSQRQVVLAWHVWTDQEAYSDLPILSGAPTQTETSSGYPCDHNQCHADPGLWHFPACWSMVQLHRRLPHRIPVGEANQEPRSRYSDPTFSECLQPVWLAYGGSDQSRLSVHFQRLARTLLEIQHRPQARVPSPSVEEQPLRKCHW